MKNWRLMVIITALGALTAPSLAADDPSADRPPERPVLDAPSASEKPDMQPAQTKPARESKPAGTTSTPVRETDTDYNNCLNALAYLGTSYREVAPVSEASDSECGITRPILVTGIIPGVSLQSGAVMRCDTARRLGLWTKQFVHPAARALPQPLELTELRLGSTYACRTRRGTGNTRPKLSQHAVGNAIDIASFGFADGSEIIVSPRNDTGDQAESFQSSARSSACIYFTTVLGPGSNAAHGNHLHLDIIERNRGWRLCQ